MSTKSNNAITRQQFLRGFWPNFAADFKRGESMAIKLPEAILLPPGSPSWSHLIENCNKCYDCVSSCPHEALRVIWNTGDDREGLPGIYANISACQNCTQRPCISVCPSNALQPEESGARGQVIHIEERNCLSYQDQFCITCTNQCPGEHKALILDSQGHPAWIQELCAGCGICIQACPAPGGAITIRYKEQACPLPVSSS